MHNNNSWETIKQTLEIFPRILLSSDFNEILALTNNTAFTQEIDLLESLHQEFDYNEDYTNYIELLQVKGQEFRDSQLD